MRKVQCRVQLEEEAIGEGDLIKMDEICRRERNTLLEEMNFQFAQG